MWLRDALPVDIPNLRTHVYGYPSSLQKSVSTARLVDYTDVFTHSLRKYLQPNETVSMNSSTWTDLFLTKE